MHDYDDVNFENLHFCEEDEKVYEDELDVECKHFDTEGVPKSALRALSASSPNDKSVAFNLNDSSVMEIRALEKWNDNEEDCKAVAAMEEDTEGEPDGFAQPLVMMETGPFVEKNSQLTQEVESLRATVESLKAAHHDDMRHRHALQEKIIHLEDTLRQKEGQCSPPLSPLALMGRHDSNLSTKPTLSVKSDVAQVKLRPAPLSLKNPPMKSPPPPPPAPADSRVRLEQANLNLDHAALMLERVRLGQDKTAQETKLEQERAELLAKQTQLEGERNELERLKDEFKHNKVGLEQEKIAFCEEKEEFNKERSANKATVEQEKLRLEQEKTLLEHEKSRWELEKLKIQTEKDRLDTEKEIWAREKEKEAERHEVKAGTGKPLQMTTLTHKGALPADGDLEVSTLLPRPTSKSNEHELARRRRRLRCWTLCFVVVLCVAIIVGGIKWAESAGMRVGQQL